MLLLPPSPRTGIKHRSPTRRTLKSAEMTHTRCTYRTCNTGLGAVVGTHREGCTYKESGKRGIYPGMYRVQGGTWVYRPGYSPNSTVLPWVSLPGRGETALFYLGFSSRVEENQHCFTWVSLPGMEESALFYLGFLPGRRRK